MIKKTLTSLLLALTLTLMIGSALATTFVDVGLRSHGYHGGYRGHHGFGHSFQSGFNFGHRTRHFEHRGHHYGYRGRYDRHYYPRFVFPQRHERSPRLELDYNAPKRRHDVPR